MGPGQLGQLPAASCHTPPSRHQPATSPQLRAVLIVPHRGWHPPPQTAAQTGGTPMPCSASGHEAGSWDAPRTAARPTAPRRRDHPPGTCLHDVVPGRPRLDAQDQLGLLEGHLPGLCGRALHRGSRLLSHPALLRICTATRTRWCGWLVRWVGGANQHSKSSSTAAAAPLRQQGKAPHPHPQEHPSHSLASAWCQACVAARNSTVAPATSTWASTLVACVAARGSGASERRRRRRGGRVGEGRGHAAAKADMHVTAAFRALRQASTTTYHDGGSAAGDGDLLLRAS